ncbi:hypothetical protein AC56_5517 [Escherichia coli 1-182-04_S3_C3]|nr:hypothetical protein AC56_5517 [Escherichia coli 1-182-04_S3_C3]
MLRQSRPSTFDNKLSLHFSQGTHHMKEEAPHRRTRIDAIRQAPEVNTFLPQFLH